MEEIEKYIRSILSINQCFDDKNKLDATLISPSYHVCDTLDPIATGQAELKKERIEQRRREERRSDIHPDEPLAPFIVLVILGAKYAAFLDMYACMVLSLK